MIHQKGIYPCYFHQTHSIIHKALGPIANMASKIAQYNHMEQDVHGHIIGVVSVAYAFKVYQHNISFIQNSS